MGCISKCNDELFDITGLLADALMPPTNFYYQENNLVGDGQGHIYLFGNDHMYNNNEKNIAIRYKIDTDTWESVDNYYGNGIRGTVTSDDESYIYIIPAGGNDRRIIQYDTWDNRFSPSGLQPDSWQRMPWDKNSSWEWYNENSTTAAYDGYKYMYAIGADEGNWARFLKFNIQTQESEYLPPPPYVGIGGSLTFLGNDLYYLPARNTPNFYRFDFNTQSWKNMASMPLTVYRPGSGNLIAVNGELFAHRGQQGTQFYKYIPDSGQGAWVRLADSPARIYNGAYSYDGGDYIYAIRGYGSSTFYRYQISTDSWTTLANFPSGTSYGATSIYNNGKVYATVGAWNNDMYVYDVASDTWGSPLFTGAVSVRCNLCRNRQHQNDSLIR